VGVLLLVWVYYDPFPKSLYHNYVMGKVAGLGIVLTAGTLWFWFRRRKRNGDNLR
jgi:LPXTG-motif cell wall-anchored protein